jgi:hypothetical protein
MSPVVPDNKNIILIGTKQMQNPTTIVVLQQEELEQFNITKRGVGLGNHKSLTDGMIAIGGQKRQPSIWIIDIDRIDKISLIRSV